MRSLMPLEKVYCLRFALGLLAAVLCAGYAVGANRIPQVVHGQPFPGDTSLFFNSISIAIVIYLLSYYAIKSWFVNQVQKKQKLFTMGIGIYFIGWIVLWALFYTILAGQPI